MQKLFRWRNFGLLMHKDWEWQALSICTVGQHQVCDCFWDLTTWLCQGSGEASNYPVGCVFLGHLGMFSNVCWPGTTFRHGCDWTFTFGSFHNFRMLHPMRTTDKHTSLDMESFHMAKYLKLEKKSTQRILILSGEGQSYHNYDNDNVGHNWHFSWVALSQSLKIHSPVELIEVSGCFWCQVVRGSVFCESIQ